jgi:hypothetical protein
MRHLHLVVDHEPAPTDFPPTWHEFEAARRRFLARLEDPAATAPADGADSAVRAEVPREPVAT